MKNSILRFMKNNRLRLGLALIIFLYGGFLTYFCLAKPSEPNNIAIEQEKTTGQNTSTAKTVGPEFYLSEITTFYERVITILFGIIGVLLVFSFVYVHLTSKKQAEDMAREALDYESFRIVLAQKIDDRFTESKNTGDIGDIFEKQEELDKRIEFLEEQANIQGYELSDEGSGEVNDGNN